MRRRQCKICSCRVVLWVVLSFGLVSGDNETETTEASTTCTGNPTSIANLDDRSTACAYVDPGVECRFFCKSGFKPTGNVTCLSDGTWSTESECRNVWFAEELVAAVAFYWFVLLLIGFACCIPIVCARSGRPLKNPWLKGTKAEIHSGVEMTSRSIEDGSSSSKIQKMNVAMKKIFERAYEKHRLQSDEDEKITYDDVSDILENHDISSRPVPLRFVKAVIDLEKAATRKRTTFDANNAFDVETLDHKGVKIRRERRRKEQKKREKIRKAGKKMLSLLSRLEKYLNHVVDTNVKESKIEKSSYPIYLDVLHDFVHHEYEGGSRHLKSDEREDAVLLDREGNKLVYSQDELAEQFSTNVHGNPASLYDRICCLTINRISSFYQRFWWHFTLWICVDVFAVAAIVLLYVHLHTKYQTSPWLLVSEGFSGTLEVE